MAELDELDILPEEDEEAEKKAGILGKGRKNKKKAAAAAGAAAGSKFVPSEPKDSWLPERIRILKDRRALRRDLRLHGITSRADFNAIADSLGLSLWNDGGILLWLHYVWEGLKAGMGLKYLLAAAAALLAALFLMSYITESKGSFTINLTADMLRAGYVLYDNADFRQPETRLFSDPVEQVTNITLTDIPADVDQIDGPHNGRNHLAYTFYIRNEGEQAGDYAWYMNLVSESMGVGKAVWIMLFEDGNQVLYAQRSPQGQPEELYGFREAPFSDVAYAYDQQYYQRDDRYGIITTPYAEPNIVAQGIIRGVEPGEAHKYTVVLWLEGNDPECTDEIFGGYAKYSMDFENISAEDDDGLFSGLFRTEYKNYGQNPN